MAISRKDVDYVARLARLELSEEEKRTYAEQLGKILEYVEQLKELNTDNVPPTSHVLGLANVWREDKAVPCPEDVRERIMDNAPERDDNFFKVKKVIE